MHNLINIALLFSLSLTCFADSTVYQTAPKPSAPNAESTLNVPLISVNPDTGKTRVFITPDGSFSDRLAPHGAPVYHALALYNPTPAGIPASLVKLHQQMADTCPDGWIKLQEWATLQTNAPELHYQFQCLHASPQD